MMEFLNTAWDYIRMFFASINPITSLVDILFVAFVLYSLIKMVRDSRAEQLIKGIVVLGLVYLVAYLVDLRTVSFLLEKLFDNGLVLLVVVFQPELRRALEHAGYSRFGRNLFRFGKGDDEYVKRWETAIDSVCSAAELLQKQRMGALMVFERNTRLGDILDTGTVINADTTPELIGNIFFNKAPLHDGAMILRDGKICAAGCILPLTDKLELSSELGTRHRAAVGMSENSDALVVVVSEESGTVSVAQGGTLLRGFDRESLRALLEREMLRSNTKEEGGKKEKSGKKEKGKKREEKK